MLTALPAAYPVQYLAVSFKDEEWLNTPNTLGFIYCNDVMPAYKDNSAAQGELLFTANEEP